MNHDVLEVFRSVRLLNRASDSLEEDILYPFALEEILCKQVGEGASPIIHLWRHPRAFVMGLRDSKLPCAKQAQAELMQEGYAVAVRNSGGAAVPLDSGVVNVTMILPKGEGNMDFHLDFERMYRFLQLVLNKWTSSVDKGEITGSYCPGDYDLSIGGRKFCGIAQRRQLRALTVQAFVVVENEGAQYAHRAQAFYDQAACGESVSFPNVTEEAMISLSEAFGIPISADEFVDELIVTLEQLGSMTVLPNDQLPPDQEIRTMIGVLRNRYGLPLSS